MAEIKTLAHNLHDKWTGHQVAFVWTTYVLSWYPVLIMMMTGYQDIENPSWAPVRNRVHPSEFAFQKSRAIVNNFCGICSYALTRVNSILHSTGTRDWFHFFHKFLSCDNYTKTSEITQIVGNHGQSPEITAGFGRKYNVMQWSICNSFEDGTALDFIYICLIFKWVAVTCLQHIEAETKWPPFSRRYFQMHFLEWKYMISDFYITEVCSWGSNWQYSSIGSNNGLAPGRRQAIIWTNDG